MKNSSYLFVFNYSFGSFGVVADTLQEAKKVFRQHIQGESHLPFTFPPEENWKVRARRQRRNEKFKELGLDVDFIEPEIYKV